MNEYLYLIICLLMMLSPRCLRSQALRSSSQTNYNSSGTYSLHFTDAFSFLYNQASLAQTKSISAGLYSEKRFVLKELKIVSAAISFPCLPHSGAGIIADYIGFKDFNQSHIGMAYGRSLGTRVDLGIQFDYHHVSIAGYGAASAINFEIGTIWHLTEKIHAGFHVYNPVGGRFGKDNTEKIPSVYSFGLGYEASERLLIGSQLVKEENQPSTVNIAIHYAFAELAFIRGGLSSGVGTYFAGAGVLWKNFRVDIIAERHPQGGLTPALLVIFLFSKPDQGKL